MRNILWLLLARESLITSQRAKVVVVNQLLITATKTKRRSWRSWQSVAWNTMTQGTSCQAERDNNLNSAKSFSMYHGVTLDGSGKAKQRERERARGETTAKTKDIMATTTITTTSRTTGGNEENGPHKAGTAPINKTKQQRKMWASNICRSRPELRCGKSPNSRRPLKANAVENGSLLLLLLLLLKWKRGHAPHATRGIERDLLVIKTNKWNNFDCKQ